MADTRIFNIDPTRLTLENYSISDASLINDTTTTVAFNPTTDYIEYFIYELNGDNNISDVFDAIISINTLV